MPQANPYPLRVSQTIMNKFKFLAAENGRSVNKELETLMKRAIAEYERINGSILVPCEEDE